jgi:hypothetical protein
MFSILKWFLGIILFFVGIYFLFFLYSSFKSSNLSNILNSSINIASTTNTSSQISSSSILRNFVEFFRPQFFSPLTVIPSFDTYSVLQNYNNNTINRDFYNYLESINYPNRNYSNNIFATNTEIYYNQNLIYNRFYQEDNRLEMLFPSIWMQGR